MKCRRCNLHRECAVAVSRDKGRAEHSFALCETCLLALLEEVRAVKSARAEHAEMLARLEPSDREEVP